MQTRYLFSIILNISAPIEEWLGRGEGRQGCSNTYPPFFEASSMLAPTTFLSITDAPRSQNKRINTRQTHSTDDELQFDIRISAIVDGILEQADRYFIKLLRVEGLFGLCPLCSTSCFANSKQAGRLCQWLAWLFCPDFTRMVCVPSYIRAYLQLCWIELDGKGQLLV